MNAKVLCSRHTHTCTSSEASSEAPSASVAAALPHTSRAASLDITCSSFSARESMKQRGSGSALQTASLRVVMSRHELPRRSTSGARGWCW